MISFRRRSCIFLSSSVPHGVKRPLHWLPFPGTGVRQMGLNNLPRTTVCKRLLTFLMLSVSLPGRPDYFQDPEKWDRKLCKMNYEHSESSHIILIRSFEIPQKIYL